MTNKIRFWTGRLLSLSLITVVLFEFLTMGVYGQDADLESRRIEYKKSMIEIGDDRYSRLKEDEIVDFIISSAHTSPETRDRAQKFQNDLLLYRVWITANSLTPALYWGGFWVVSNTDPKIISDNVWLVGVGVGLSILSGVSFSFAGIFQPDLPATLVESYNEDLRKSLNLTQEDIHRL